MVMPTEGPRTKRIFRRDASPADSTTVKLRSGTNSAIRSRWAKSLAFALSLTPVVALMWTARSENFSADAMTFIIRQTGDWSLIFLLFTLAITPLRRVYNLPDLVRSRRMLGLFAFFDGCLHLAAWRVFKYGTTLRVESFNRWSLRIGVVALVVMLSLAVTSTDGWIRRMGGRRWRALHSLIYLSAVAGLVYYCLLPYIGIWKPAVFSFFLACFTAFASDQSIRDAEEIE